MTPTQKVGVLHVLALFFSSVFCPFSRVSLLLSLCFSHLETSKQPTKWGYRGCNYLGVTGMSQLNFFLKLFGHARDIPAKSRDIPPKSLVSLGFEAHTELFGPHPFTWKTPTPPENSRTKKFRFGFLFLPSHDMGQSNCVLPGRIVRGVPRRGRPIGNRLTKYNAEAWKRKNTHKETNT